MANTVFIPLNEVNRPHLVSEKKKHLLLWSLFLLRQNTTEIDSARKRPVNLLGARTRASKPPCFYFSPHLRQNKSCFHFRWSDKHDFRTTSMQSRDDLDSKCRPDRGVMNRHRCAICVGWSELKMPFWKTAVQFDTCHTKLLFIFLVCLCSKLPKFK